MFMFSDPHCKDVISVLLNPWINVILIITPILLEFHNSNKISKENEHNNTEIYIKGQKKGE